MEVKEFIGKVQIAYKGKGAHKAPLFGSAKHNLYLSIANSLLQGWAADPNYNWDTLWTEEKVTYTGSSVEVPDGFIRLADELEVRVNGRVSYFTPIDVTQRKRYRNAAFVNGHSPKVISFTNPIDSIYTGGELVIPCYIKPPVLAKEKDEIICDNTDWLIYATAAELARNDPAKDDQSPNLIGLANVEYRKMTDAAKAIVQGQPSRMEYRSTGFNVGGSV